MPDHINNAPVSIAYHALLDDGCLQPDMAQEALVQRLAMVQQEWAKNAVSGGFFDKLFGKNDAPRTTQGMYIWGGVGRGKSLLMDLFFESSPRKHKRRVHYHAFMIEVHERIHVWRQNHDDTAGNDPIGPLAAQIAEEVELLCLDEMQVTDIADAMILGRLFSLLFNHGVRVMFTSNRKPDDLYLHGLQREQFLPFIALVHERLTVLELNSEEDYRLRQLKALQEVYIVEPPAKAKPRMDAAFNQLIHEAPSQAVVADVQGHELHIPACQGDVARFEFTDLCSKAYGAADYAYIAQEFTTVLVDNIPLLTPEKRNEAKRFVTLVDTLYEHKVKLLCSAAAHPDDLYPKGDGSFEFARTASRLMEMQSESYLAASHEVA